MGQGTRLVPPLLGEWLVPEKVSESGDNCDSLQLIRATSSQWGVWEGQPLRILQMRYLNLRGHERSQQ